MTDISKLADDLIALNNAKPRLPTRDEILSLLMAAVIQRTEEAVEAELRQIRNARQDAWNALTPSEKAARPCFAYSSERHHYEVDPHSTRVALPDEVPNRCNCGAIDHTDTRTVKERAAAIAAAIKARYEANRKELAEPPLEPKGAPIEIERAWTQWVPVDHMLITDVMVGPNLTGAEAKQIGAEACDRASVMVRGGEVKFRKQHPHPLIHRNADIKLPTGNTPNIVPVETLHASLGKYAEQAKKCIPGYLDESGNSRYITSMTEDYTAVIKRDGDTTVATVYTVNNPPKTYHVSQAALDNALSCENGHDWEGDSHVCHRCGARAILGVNKWKTRPHVESEEF